MCFYLNYFFRNKGLNFIQTAEADTSINTYAVALTPPLNNIFTGTKYSKSGFPHFVYVPYIPREIACSQVTERLSLLLSSKFTGCAMAYFEHDNYGAFVAHIPLEGNSTIISTWNDFIRTEQKNITRYIIFKPFRHDTAMCNFVSNSTTPFIYSCIGMITLDNDCYSLLVREARPNLNIPITLISYEKIPPAFCHRSDMLKLESSIKRFLIPKKPKTAKW